MGKTHHLVWHNLKELIVSMICERQHADHCRSTNEHVHTNTAMGKTHHLVWHDLKELVVHDL